MHGNVWEWCLDFYGEDYQKLPASDPVNVNKSGDRVQRGGCGILYAPASRAANRAKGPEDRQSITSGMRLVLSA
jgi:formylglycine-generating enzyme required for sulfatase activity